MNVEFQRSVVTLFSVMQVNEEEYIGPYVMLLVYVVVKSLQKIISE